MQMILLTIPENIQFLFDQYSHVECHPLKQKEYNIENLAYPITEPPVIMFNAIKQLRDLSIAAQILRSHQQII